MFGSRGCDTQGCAGAGSFQNLGLRAAVLRYSGVSPEGTANFAGFQCHGQYTSANPSTSHNPGAGPGTWSLLMSGSCFPAMQPLANNFPSMSPNVHFYRVGLEVCSSSA